MRNRTIALIGAGLLVAALGLGTLSTTLAQTPTAGGWGPGGMMGRYGPMRGPTMGQNGPMTGPMMGGSGMMGGNGPGGMMGGWPGTTGQVAPLSSLPEARQAFRAYLERLGNADLALGEVMEFERNFYAIVKEQSTGSGAFELLANKQNGAVFPEPGPYMMWNTQYGHMDGVGGDGMRGGMMRGWQGAAPGGQISVTPEQARELAQQWLDTYQPGSTTEEPDSFPGYYTLHTVKDGTISGMLSVNAATGQIWYHGWHGTFIAESEA